jgi:uncharacterized damage-inducible protein DinB
MAIIDGMLQELEFEAEATRRVLARVPEDQFAWRPHPKARTLGELALHIARSPGGVASLVVKDEVERPSFIDPVPATRAEVMDTFDASVATARQLLGGLDDQALAATWRVKRGDREVFAVPRGAFLRSVMLNHLYHHRGQLTVYLRELDVPVPAIYGPSADEDPFA